MSSRFVFDSDDNVHCIIATLSSVEQLRRLDEAIRFKLAEKQKVICDMYRVPNEHFSEIADIASQPEAPKVCYPESHCLTLQNLI